MKTSIKNFSIGSGISILLKHFTDLYLKSYFKDKLTTRKNIEALDELFNFAIESLSQLVKNQTIDKYYFENSVYFLALFVMTSKQASKKQIKLVLDAIYDDKHGK